MLDFSKTVSYSELKPGKYWMLDISNPGWMGYYNVISAWRHQAIIPFEITIEKIDGGEMIYTVTTSPHYQRKVLSTRILSKNSEPLKFLSDYLFKSRIIVLFSDKKFGEDFGKAYLPEIWNNSSSPELIKYISELENGIAEYLEERKDLSDDINKLELASNNLKASSSKNYLRAAIRKIENSIGSRALLRNSRLMIQLIKNGKTD